MKKKIINGLLMMALVVSTTSSFVSCKDTVGDDNARLEELFYQQNDYMKTVLLEQITNLRNDLTTLQNQYGTDIGKILNLNTVNNGNGGYLGEVTFLQKYADLLDILEAFTKEIEVPGTGAGGGSTTQNLSQWIAAINQMLNDLAGQGDEQATSIKALIERVKALEDAVQTLQNQVNTNTGDITNIKSQLLTLSSTLNTLSTTVENEMKDIKARLTVLEGKIDNLNYMSPGEVQTLINGLDAKFNDYYKKSDVYTKDEIVQTLSGYFTKEEVQKIKEDIEETLGGKADKATIEAMKKEIDDKFGNYYTKEEIDAMKQAVDERIASLESHKVYVDTRLKNISDSLATAYSKLALANEEIASIKDNYATKQALADSIAKLRSEILSTEGASKEYVDALVKALNKKFNDYFTKDEIQAELSKYYTQEQINNMLNGYYTKEQIDDMLTKYFTKEDAEKLQNSIDEINTKIGDIQKDIENLQKEDEAIKERLTNLENSVKALTDRVDAIETNVSKIFSAMKKQVTGIIVQGAYSPVFGIGMLPVDAKTNILAAYYGYATKEVVFPAKNANNYVDQDEFWLPGNEGEGQFIEDIEPYTAGANQLLLSDAEDNAGKLYLTVNPAQVDFTDKIIEIENSQGTAAPIALSPLRKSNYKLSFGWTRSAQNGFYEAKAKISAENLEAAKARIDVDALKEVAKDLYNKHNKASLKEAAQAIISQKGDILDAQAAKATYEGVDEKGNVENKNILSDYSIATTVIKPLSYNTLRGWNPTSIPGISKIEDFINKIVNKVDIKVNFGFGKITVPTIKQIELIELTDEMKAKFKFHLTVDSTMSDPKDPIMITAKVTGKTDTKVISGEVKDKNGNVIGTYSQEVGGFTVNTTASGKASPFNLHIVVEEDLSDEIEELYGNLQKPMANVNQMLADLQKFMDEIQPMFDKIANMDANINGQIENAKNSIKSEIISYIDRFEKKVLSYASYVNQAMQPVLLYKSVNGLARVSTIEKGASKMTGTVLLVPTSFNAELLSPAFKKLVVCTGAWKADGTFDANEAKRVNGAGFENFGKVFEGQERVASFEGKAGYKYRIVYQALDYHGMIASSRYYVQY